MGVGGARGDPGSKETERSPDWRGSVGGVLSSKATGRGFHSHLSKNK